MSSSRLLIDEHPLQVIPSLAAAIGLNESIFVQQLHYWLRSMSGKEIDGQRWIHNTVDEWHQQFPFWSRNTVQRVIRCTEEAGYVMATADHNRRGGDRTKWYTINYRALETAQISQDAESHEQDGIFHEQDPNLGSAKPQNGVAQYPNLGRPLPESPTETTTEKNPPPSETSSPQSSGHDAPEAEEASRADKKEPIASDFVALLDEDLRSADVPLMDGRKARYGREFRQALERGVSAEILYRASDRIVERWLDDNDHYKLTVEQAVGDVSNGGNQRRSSTNSHDGPSGSYRKNVVPPGYGRMVSNEEVGL